MTGKTGQRGLKRCAGDKNAWKGQLGQDGWDSTDGTRKLGQDSRDRTARSGQPGQDSMDRTAWTGQPDGTVGIVWPGQES